MCWFKERYDNSTTWSLLPAQYNTGSFFAYNMLRTIQSYDSLWTDALRLISPGLLAELTTLFFVVVRRKKVAHLLQT